MAEHPDEIYEKLFNPIPDNKRDALVFPRDNPGNFCDCVEFIPIPPGGGVSNADPGIKKVSLFMPISISTQYQANWEGKDLKVNGDPRGLAEQSLKRLFDSTENVIGAVGLGQGTLGSSAERANIERGIAENTNTRILFKQMGLREVSFDWTIAPKSEQEVRELNKIVKSFKLGMHPKLINGAGVNRYLRVPYTWNIRFISEKDRSGVRGPYFRIKQAAITSASLDYGNQTSYVTLPDGSPTQVKLKINVQELKQLTQDDIRIDGA